MDRKRRMMSAQSTSVTQQLMDGAPFVAQLTKTLALQRGTGSPTFTRATTATVLGYGPTANSGDSQVLLSCASGEARFQGARRISQDVWSDTFADGTPIPLSALKGYLAEGARTNLCTYSNGFDNAAWSKLNSGTGVAPVVTPNYAVAPDGTTTAYRLQLNRGAGVGSENYSLLRSAPAAGLVDPHTSDESLWVKTTSGGTATILFGSSYAEGFSVTVTNEWTRLDKSQSVSLTIDAIDIYLRNGVSLTNDQSADILIWGAQLELGSFASSYIPTTTIAVARNADVLTYSSAGNIDGTVGWFYAETSEVAWTTSITSYAPCVADFGAAQMPAFKEFATGDLAFNDSSATQVSGTDYTGSQATKKLSMTWGGTTGRQALNGAVLTAKTFAGFTVGVNIAIGNRGTPDNLYAWNGNIKNLRIGQRQLSSSELQAITQ